MTIAIQRAGWDGGAHLINAFIIVVCILAISSSIYTGSRSMVNLANEGCAPSILKRVNGQGVPYAAVILMSTLGLIINESKYRCCQCLSIHCQSFWCRCVYCVG